MKTLTLGVDVDETVADLLGPWLRRYNHATGDNILPEDLTEWDLTKVLSKVTSDELYGFLDASLYDVVMPIPGARKAIYGLATQGHRVVYVTSCTRGTADAKLEWLQRWGFLPRQRFQPNFIAASDKSMIDVDCLFDDRPDSVESFPRMAWLISQPQNLTTATRRIRLKSMVDAPWAVEQFLNSPYRDAA
jgi:5'(3')-deoxyribonucleotidase